MATINVVQKNLPKIVGVMPLALLLAGCLGNTQTTPIDLESRTIAVEQNAEPTSGGPGVGAVAHLLPVAGPSYVTLTITEVDKQNGTSRDGVKQAITSGSGFLVDSNGWVMTAAHVAVKKDNLVSARAANGRIYSGKVVAVNPTNDMAVIKLRGYTGKAVTPAANVCVPKGATVFTLGKPHAQGDTARVGALDSMSFGRAVKYGKFGYPDAMVLRMSTRKGESGGPVFDEQGRLIGMVVSTLSDQAGNPINQSHAVYGASLAKYLCSQSQCNTNWAALAQKSPSSCSDI